MSEKNETVLVPVKSDDSRGKRSDYQPIVEATQFKNNVNAGDSLAVAEDALAVQEQKGNPGE